MDEHSAGDAAGAKFFADHPELAPAGWKGVRPDSVRLYQNIAAFRRELQNPDIPTEVLRAMLQRALVAAEELLQALDALQDVCERLARQ